MGIVRRCQAGRHDWSLPRRPSRPPRGRTLTTRLDRRTRSQARWPICKQFETPLSASCKDTWHLSRFARWPDGTGLLTRN